MTTVSELSTEPPRPKRDEELTVEVTLEVTGGVDRGRRFAVDPESPGAIWIGRSEIARVRLTDPTVSRRHATLSADGAELRIGDASRGGCHVNGVRVYDAALVDGDVVRVGNTEMVVHLTVVSAPARAPGATSWGRIRGASPEMTRLHPLFDAAARSAEPLLIEGETGTGKELLAEAIHERGRRPEGPFVVVDCGAAGQTGDLFAAPPALSAFERARSGTLVLDEIGDLSSGLQAALVRVLELRTDIRVIATSRRDLEHEVTTGRFSDELYRWVSALRIELPPLRKRRGDAVALARTFWREHGGVGAVPLDLLRAAHEDPWPGNVRELLDAVIGRVQARTSPSSPPGERKEANDDVIAAVIAQNLPFSRARRVVLDRFDQRYVEWMLTKHGGNATRAAADSGIALRYFHQVRRRTQQ